MKVRISVTNESGACETTDEDQRTTGVKVRFGCFY